MQIRPLEDRDILTIVNDENRIFNHSLGYDFLHGELESDLHKFFVLEDDELIEYFVLCVCNENGKILNLYINEKYKEKKYGGKLLEYGLSYLDSHNVKCVTLEVRVSNTRAINMYEKYGFKKALERKNYYGNEDAILMLLRRD